jgi:hypothetical protein
MGLGDAKAHFTITATVLNEGTVPNGMATLWDPSAHLEFASMAIARCSSPPGTRAVPGHRHAQQGAALRDHCRRRR